jgi:hypothetical protein
VFLLIYAGGCFNETDRTSKLWGQEGVNPSTKIRKRCHFGFGYDKASPHRKEEEQIDGDQESCRLGKKPALDESW